MYKFYNNRRNLASNLLFSANWAWSRHKSNIKPNENFLRANGYQILKETPQSSELASGISKIYDEEIQANNKDLRYENENILKFDNFTKYIGNVNSVIDHRTEEVLTQYYQSNFKAYMIELYRTLPSQNYDAYSSFLWHTDNQVHSVMKLMFYLKDVSEETGAMHIIGKEDSSNIIANGFFSKDRKTANECFKEDLEKHKVVLEGKAGATVFFDNNMLHRATFPKVNHRDVIVMSFVPSTAPFHDHFEKYKHRLCWNVHKRKFPRNPFRALP